MQFSKIFTKLISIGSEVHNLQPKTEPTPTTTDRKPDLRDDSNRTTRPIITDQKLLTLYKVMDMGA